MDIVLVNTAALPGSAVDQYAVTGARPVAVNQAALEKRGVEVIGTDLLADGELVRHDPAKLSAALLAVASNPGAAGEPEG